MTKIELIKSLIQDGWYRSMVSGNNIAIINKNDYKFSYKPKDFAKLKDLWVEYQDTDIHGNPTTKYIRPDLEDISDVDWSLARVETDFAKGSTFMDNGFMMINTFRGFIWERPGNHKLLNLDEVEPIFDVIASLAENDVENTEWVIDWIADMIQNPANKPGTALVFQGAEGTGKGTIFNKMMTRLLGRDIALNTSIDVFGRNFNADLLGKLYLNLDEGGWDKSKSSIGRIKSFITEPTFSYEMKGKDVINTNNCTRLVMTTNEDWAIKANGEARRFAIFNPVIENHDWTKINELLDNDDVIYTCFMILKNKEIKSNLRVAPITEAKIDQQEISKSRIEEFLDIIDDEESYIQDDDGKVSFWQNSSNISSECGFPLVAQMKAVALKYNQLYKDFKSPKSISHLIKITLNRGKYNQYKIETIRHTTYLFYNPECGNSGNSGNSGNKFSIRKNNIENKSTFFNALFPHFPTSDIITSGTVLFNDLSDKALDKIYGAKDNIKPATEKEGQVIYFEKDGCNINDVDCGTSWTTSKEKTSDSKYQFRTLNPVVLDYGKDISDEITNTFKTIRNCTSFKRMLFEIDDTPDGKKAETPEEKQEILNFCNKVQNDKMPFMEMTSSGNKSVHCIIEATNEPENLQEYALRWFYLNAKYMNNRCDTTAARTPDRANRTPNAIRDNGKKQEAILTPDNALPPINFETDEPEYKEFKKAFENWKENKKEIDKEHKEAMESALKENKISGEWSYEKLENYYAKRGVDVSGFEGRNEYCFHLANSLAGLVETAGLDINLAKSYYLDKAKSSGCEEVRTAGRNLLNK